MNEQVQINDGLVNVLANLGTGRDKASHATYAFNQKSPQELLAAYRSSWLPRKVVDIPALDSTRRWRSWNADKDQITAIEAVEKRLELQRKTRDLIIAGRLYGGAALYISTGNVNVHKPFNPEREVIRHLTLIPKQMLLPVRNLFDIDSPNFGQPELYSINNGTKQVEVHHTRLVRWIGASVPATDVFEHDGWGDSVLTALFDAVSQSDATAANIASLVYEAKVDILHIPRLMELIKTPQGEQQVRAYLHTIMAAKSTNGALVLDGGDTSQPEGKTGGVRYDSKTQSFSGLDSIWDRMLQAVAGAADIPATRLLGQSPAGLNATGESDLRNYYDRIQSIQELDIQPAMALVDQAIVREATGGPMDDIYYNWRSLWQTTDKEQAELGKITVGIITEMKETGLWPDEVLAEAGSNALIETGAVPGLEAALDEWVGGGSEISDEPDLTQPVERASPELRVVGDATPRPLYVRRNVLNGEEILRWAKSQGFGKTLTADDLHVTIAYSRQPVDWMQMGESWADRLEVAAGGPRVVERFGDATVLLFACSELEWRHESFKGKGASWDHPEYQPHITISYDAGDPEAIKPYTGKIVLGPEIFEPIDEGWKEKVVGDSDQPRVPAGSSAGGQFASKGGASAGGQHKPVEELQVVGQRGGHTYTENIIPHLAERDLTGIDESLASDRATSMHIRDLSVTHDVSFGEQKIDPRELKTVQSTLRKENLIRLMELPESELSGGSPITVYLLPDGSKVLKDGNHRVAAMLYAGLGPQDFETISFTPLKKGRESKVTGDSDQPRVPAGSPAGGQFASSKSPGGFGSGLKGKVEFGVGDNPLPRSDLNVYAAVGKKRFTQKWDRAFKEEVLDVKTLKVRQTTLDKAETNLSPIKDPDSLPPIKVARVNGENIVLDGNHRAASLFLQGHSKVKADVIDLDDPKNASLIDRNKLED